MKALIIGATGLVGKEMVKLMLEDSSFSEVHVFVRRPMNMTHAKLHEHVVDFDDLKTWSILLKGDVLFCAMGTTIKAAGSKKAQWKVDFEYPLEVSKMAHANGVGKMVLISSVGADSRSPFFYLKTKGVLEEALGEIGFQGLAIIRPSLLEGDREVARVGESFSHFFLSKLPRMKLFSRLIPVHGKTVAKNAIEQSRKVSGKKIVEPQDLYL
jgi:uncharacterized protein YbjT (DUF2867 family)